MDEKVKWVVGDRKSIRVNGDKWLSIHPLRGHADRDEHLRVTDLIDQEKDIQKLNSIFEGNIVQEILNIPLCIHPTRDTLVWAENKNGMYTVKSGYNSIHTSTANQKTEQATSSYQPPRILWCSIWSLKISPKILFFLWNVCQNALPTTDNLYKRKVIPDRRLEADEARRHRISRAPIYTSV